MPSEPCVSFTDLYDWAPKGAYADDRVVDLRLVSDKECHRAARRAHVLVRPGVSKVAPNVLQPQIRVFAPLVALDELEVGIDDCPERSRPLLAWQFASFS